MAAGVFILLLYASIMGTCALAERAFGRSCDTALARRRAQEDMQRMEHVSLAPRSVEAWAHESWCATCITQPPTDSSQPTTNSGETP